MYSSVSWPVCVCRCLYFITSIYHSLHVVVDAVYVVSGVEQWVIANFLMACMLIGMK